MTQNLIAVFMITKMRQTKLADEYGVKITHLEAQIAQSTEEHAIAQEEISREYEEGKALYQKQASQTEKSLKAEYAKKCNELRRQHIEEKERLQRQHTEEKELL